MAEATKDLAKTNPGDYPSEREFEIRNEKQDEEAGNTRLYRIVMSESAPVTPAEVGRRWRHAIALRVDLDKKMANPKYGKKAQNRDLSLFHNEDMAR